MHNGGDRHKDFEAELDLTAAQRAKVANIRTSFKPKFEALRNDTSLTEEQKRAKRKELMKQQQQQMKAVLTTEQVKKLEASKQQHSRKKSK
jgi:Spy/CpxP family protein refolding chaperone